MRITFCVVFQVVATVDESNPLDEITKPREDGDHCDLADYINARIAELSLTNDEKKVRNNAVGLAI